CEIDAPESVVLHAGLGQRAVQVQHADQSGPLAAPVGDRQNRAAMRVQAMEQMMAVLPHGLHHDERRIARDLAEHFHPVFLAVDEAALFLRIVWMTTLYLASFALDGANDGSLGALLRRPALLICRQSQVAV